jgi:hypothetical protein
MYENSIIAKMNKIIIVIWKSQHAYVCNNNNNNENSNERKCLL